MSKVCPRFETLDNLGYPRLSKVCSRFYQVFKETLDKFSQGKNPVPTDDISSQHSEISTSHSTTYGSVSAAPDVLPGIIIYH